MRETIKLEQPKAEIVNKNGLFYIVYGWNKETVVGNHRIPLRECIGVHRFEWMAKRTMRRWLKANK